MFEDELSDIAVFELLQDIPPEWGPILAGEPPGAAGGTPPRRPAAGPGNLPRAGVCSHTRLRPRSPEPSPPSQHPPTGWDATELDGNFTFTAVSNPQGDTQKVTTGM